MNVAQPDPGSRRSEFVPVAEPFLAGNELAYVTNAIKSTWISSTGEFLDRFEREFAAACDAHHCLGVTNGTDALHLALSALGVSAGDEVICPSLTYIASANAIRYCGATPVFADVSPSSWTLDAAAVEAAITPRTRAIVAVHLYGHPADMDALAAIARRHDLWIVEDAAEAHFARYRGRVVGGLGNAGAFSFFGNKILTCGEGGAVVTNDATLRDRMAMLKGQGMDPNERYSFPVLGHNWRLTNVAAAILCAQLEQAEEIQRRRRQVYDWYVEELGDVPGILFQPHEPWAEVAPWLFCITIDADFGMSAASLAEALRHRGIDTRPFFRPVHLQPPHRDAYAAHPSDLGVTLALAEAGLNLPTYPSMSEANARRVGEAIRLARP